MKFLISYTYQSYGKTSFDTIIVNAKGATTLEQLYRIFNDAVSISHGPTGVIINKIIRADLTLDEQFPSSPAHKFMEL